MYRLGKAQTTLDELQKQVISNEFSMKQNVLNKRLYTGGVPGVIAGEHWCSKEAGKSGG